MSGSNRDKGSTFVDWFFPLVGILAALLGAWFIGALQGGEHERRQTAPHQHTQSAKETAATKCASMQGRHLVECVQEQIEAAEETARSEQDLTAQQQAAWGSMLGSAWGGVGLFVTVIGTFLLYQQIKLTREALKDTGEATKQMMDANLIARASLALSQRPNLVVTADGKCFPDMAYLRQFGPGETRPRYFRPEAIVTITNISDNPATITAVHVKATQHNQYMKTDTFKVIGKGQAYILSTDETSGADHILHFGIAVTLENRDEMFRRPPDFSIMIEYIDAIGTPMALMRTYEPRNVMTGGYIIAGDAAMNFDTQMHDQKN